MIAPSIFNDVIGPVMRGPSSSHCAAALRIGRICRDLMHGNIQNALIEFDPNGSLATTHRSQGSDMGLFGGFLGFEAHDERLANYEEAISTSGMSIHIDIHPFGARHPNTYKMRLENTNYTHEITAISTGGGMIEVIEIDCAPISLFGDFYETLIYTDSPKKLMAFVESTLLFEDLILHAGENPIVQIKSTTSIPGIFLEELSHFNGVKEIVTLHPVLPVLSRKNLRVPFLTVDEMLQFNRDKDLNLFELGMEYECMRGNLSKEEVFEKMREIVQIMRTSIHEGLRGTEYEDRILGSQSVEFMRKMDQNKLVEGNVLNKIILFVSSMMEVKSSMGVIVAAPTAGACGALPGAVIGASEALQLSEDEMVRSMIAAGLIGVFIAAHATFAAEVGGCQAECGSGSCMAAGALVYLAGGSVHQSLNASSQALQNSLGMICDPVANRVEAPCLGKNVMAASNALSCANMALADYDPLIPLDQVIGAMAKVSAQMAHELRCTGLGGLSITQASKDIEARMNPDDIIPGGEDLQQISRRFKVC